MVTEKVSGRRRYLTELEKARLACYALLVSKMQKCQAPRTCLDNSVLLEAFRERVMGTPFSDFNREDPACWDAFTRALLSYLPSEVEP